MDFGLFTKAICVDCGDLTIGGKGHECKPPEQETPPLTQFERLMLLIGRGQLIARLARGRS